MNPKNAIGLLAGVALGWIGLHAQETTTEALEPDSPVVELEEFEVTSLKTFSDQAIPGETPVAFTELTKETIAAELGSRDIPLVLNTTPSVYATTDSGGAGDARVNVRGFNQRNVSIMINGVPTNDIENGWLYWSNWDGLGDVAATIQMQRGLSNVTLPTPSIGGTMNIITDPASSKAGGSVKLEAGSNGFLKGTLVLSTGLLKEKVAFTVGLVAKRGDGYARGTWVNGTGYYFGATVLINERNRIEMFVIGSPQQHGQRTFASNIAAYDANYARSLGYSEEDIAGALTQGPVDSGYAFNPNYAPVSTSYTGQQYLLGRQCTVREDAGFLNERSNYFTSPRSTSTGTPPSRRRPNWPPSSIFPAVAVAAPARSTIRPTSTDSRAVRVLLDFGPIPTPSTAVPTTGTRRSQPTKAPARCATTATRMRVNRWPSCATV